MSKKGSKNNIKNRGVAAKLRTINGLTVKPVKYIGEQGSYIAAKFEDGKLYRDEAGRPVPYGSIQSS
jgi:hypothetical protein